MNFCFSPFRRDLMKPNVLQKAVTFILFLGIVFSTIWVFAQEETSVQPKETTTQYTIAPILHENEFGSISYPVFFGSSDPQIDMAINTAIYTEGKIDQRIQTLNTLDKEGWGLQVDYEYFLKGDVLSIVINAFGDMGKGWQGQEFTPLTYDLLTGEKITLDQLFSKKEEAITYMENVLEEEVYPTLSGYMTNDALTPLPEKFFFINPLGITFYYLPADFSYLSGYSGSAHFLFSEIEPYLNLDENSLLFSLDIPQTLNLQADSKEKIAQSVTQGKLQQTPITLGDPLTDIIQKHRLQSDPDNYPGGRFIHIEDPLFRDVWLMTDNLYTGYDQSILQGIRTTRGNFYGLITGKTTQKQWQEVLGLPDSSIAIDEKTAYEYWLVPGTSDYYVFGNYKLRLHSDEKGILSAIMVME